MLENQWSFELSALWDPALRFYEHKYQIIRSLQDQGLATSFRETPASHIAVRLGDEFHEIRAHVSGLHLIGAGPNADDAKLLRAAATALEQIQPKKLTSLYVGMQFLVPVNGDYDAARRDAAAAVFGDWAVEARLKDFAVLVDSEDPDAALDINSEFGIVSKDEVAGRLARQVGRMSASEGVLASQWQNFAPPDVAFFMDTRWIPRLQQIDQLAPPLVADQLARWVTVINDAAAAFTAKLQAGVRVGGRQ